MCARTQHSLSCAAGGGALYYHASSLFEAGDIPIDTLKQVRLAREALLAKKGEQVVLLDVTGLSTVTDYYLIATGNSAPHLKALTNEVEKALGAHGIKCFRRAGEPGSGWIVADYLDFVVHIFTEDLRGYYQIERLWNDAKVIE
ncbi:MAG: ribosome silencing factor [Kiritimatiellae bacterium]|nr:ribosome silencing factor [Kiritimatiellia bacterium]